MPPRGIAIYILIVLIIAAIIYLLLPRNAPSPAPHALNTTTASTTIPVPSTALTTQPNTGDCEVTNATEPIYNGNFSLGTYAGWNSTGLGFGDAPSNMTYLNNAGAYYESPWTGWNGTFFATTYHQGTEVAPGNLTSDPFMVVEPYLNFKIISPQDDLLYVEILHDGVPVVITHYNTEAAQDNLNYTSTFVNASILTAPLICDNVQIRVFANIVGITQNAYDFIAVTNFTQAKRTYYTQGIVVNQSTDYT